MVINSFLPPFTYNMEPLPKYEIKSQTRVTYKQEWLGLSP